MLVLKLAQMCFFLRFQFFSELSLVCTALRGKTKAFAEMEANFKVGNTHCKLHVFISDENKERSK